MVAGRTDDRPRMILNGLSEGQAHGQGPAMYAPVGHVSSRSSSWPF